MTDINIVSVVGRLARDMELKYTTSGMAVANFSIAVNRSRKQGDQWVDEASFFECSLFGKQAEALKPYLKKGQQVAISGFLKQERWQGQDGNNHSVVRIGCELVQLCGNKTQNQNSGYEVDGYGYGYGQ